MNRTEGEEEEAKESLDDIIEAYLSAGEEEEVSVERNRIQEEDETQRGEQI